MISKTSRAKRDDCYVYITLPGQIESVVAGRYRLERDRYGNSIGRFVYGKSYLTRPDAVEIDPVELKLIPGNFTTGRLDGVFGALRDSGPDYWGRRLIGKYCGKSTLREIDYLLDSPEDRAGALSFGLNQEPPAPTRRFNRTIDLAKLQSTAERILLSEEMAEDDDTVQTKELLALTTSIGGARPKAVVEDRDGLWIAKFSRPDDRWNNPRVESAMLELARLCGINAARSRVEHVGDRDVLLVQRFDRTRVAGGYLKARMISALTLLRAEDSVSQRKNWSYVLLAEQMRRVVADPKNDLEELFRRACFNALISNIDDHPRNHAFIALDQDWRLSPAYDLTPSPGVSKERRDLAMELGDLGRLANERNILSQSSRYLLDLERARAILAEVKSVVKGDWYRVARAHGVSESDCDTIKSAFAYEGFEY